MQRTKALLAVTAFLLVGLTGCQPYEEGPAISFRSKEERVVNTWQVEYAFENGLDITKRYEDMRFKMDYEGFLKIYTLLDSDSVAIQEGWWELYDNDEKIRFLYTEPAVWPDRNRYEIRKLMENEMWIWDLEDSLGLEIRMISGDTLG